MNLSKKKELAVRTLKVGKERIVFVKARLDEIKEAITKQDIRDLNKDGAIIIREVVGRKTIVGRNRRRGPGKIKKKVNKRKKEYMALTRKLRKYVRGIKIQGRISPEEGKELRKKIRNKTFRSKSHMKDYLGGVKK
jgi:large subunit ribosomal protein L19e